MTTTVNTKSIKAVLGFTKVTDDALVTFVNAVHDGMNGNPAYPAPPVDMATFEAAIVSLTSLVAAAADGGKKAITLKDKQRAATIKIVLQLGHYVEIACNDDMATFTSSGFVAVSTTRTPPQPLPIPTLKTVNQGNTGQMLVAPQAVSGALSYDVRYAPVVAGATPTTFTTVTLTSSKAAPINGLTPGTVYTFQIRALGRLGYTDWSDAVNRMCI